MPLEKLKIFKVKHRPGNNTKNYALDLTKVFICQFNPTEFQISKQIHWQTDQSPGTDTQRSRFAGGSGQNMDLKFLFDVTGANGPEAKLTGAAVVVQYQILKEMMAVALETTDQTTPAKGQPPQVHVQWGAYIAFPAVITQLTERFLLFSPEGLPLRAEVTVSLQEIEGWHQEGQNPTSRSEARKTRLIQRGDRLDRIAYEEYGDTAAWRHLARANNIIDPKILTPGQILRIVPLE